ncbi:MAG: dUTPase [Pseudonocardiales bacterium]|nr:MAG: dUTPase [Pseudonocardiales bacterium]
MATDYDAPRATATSEMVEDSLEDLKERRAKNSQSSAIDVDEADLAEALEFPGADLSGEELTVRVLPMQANEFRCDSCFLVHHRSLLTDSRKGKLFCRDCAA